MSAHQHAQASAAIGFVQVGFGEVSNILVLRGKAGRLGNDNVLYHALSG
jgi:hypothetical protein